MKLLRGIRCVINGAHHVSTWLASAVLWLLLHVLVPDIECKFSEAKARRYEPKEDKPVFPDNWNNEEVLKVLIKNYESEQKARDVVTDKVKMLLTLGSMVAAAVAFFGSKIQGGWYMYVAFSPFIGIALLFVGYVGIWNEGRPNPGPDDVKQSIAQDYITAMRWNEGTTGFLVDVFKAARVLFLAALLLVVGSSYFVFHAQPSADRVKSDVVACLPGPTGSQGPPGIQGPPGLQGPPGMCACTSSSTTSTGIIE